MLEANSAQAHSEPTANASNATTILYQTYNSLLDGIKQGGAGYAAVKLYGASLSSEHPEAYTQAAVLAGAGMAIFGSVIKIFSNHSDKAEPFYKKAWNSVTGILKKHVFLLMFLEFIVAEDQHDTGKNQDNDNGSYVLFAGVAALALTVAVLSDENVKHFINNCCNKTSAHQKPGVAGRIWSGFTGFMHGASLMHTVVDVIEGFFIKPFVLASQIPRWTLTAIYGIYKSISESGILDDIIGKVRGRSNSEELPLIRHEGQEVAHISRKEVEEFIEKNSAGFALLVKLIEGVKETNPQLWGGPGIALLFLKSLEIATNHRATPSSYATVNNHLQAEGENSVPTTSANASTKCHFSPVTMYYKAKDKITSCCGKEQELTELPKENEINSDDYDDDFPQDTNKNKICCI